MIVERIELQQQPCDRSCVSTCLAMPVGMPASAMRKAYHEMYINTEAQERQLPHIFMRQFGVKLVPKLSTENELAPGKLYLLVVPSLNMQATNHEIIVDLRDGYFRVYDPNEGKEGKLWYDYQHKEEDLSPGSVNLKSWQIDYEVAMQ